MCLRPMAQAGVLERKSSLFPLSKSKDLQRIDILISAQSKPLLHASHWVEKPQP